MLLLQYVSFVYSPIHVARTEPLRFYLLDHCSSPALSTRAFLPEAEGVYPLAPPLSGTLLNHPTVFTVHGYLV